MKQNIAKDVYKIRICGDASAIQNTGEFVNIQIDGFYLRRPISVCDVEGEIGYDLMNPCLAPD